MSTKEIERLTVIKQVVEKQIRQREAMRLLKLSKRQIIRLVKRFRQEGARGLISKRRGKTSNCRIDEKKKAKSKKLLEQYYHDFGPTFAAEKLWECHGIKVSKETLRQWMMGWGLWKAKRHHAVRVHQTRERRSCFGELIQIDGSHHDWFEGRAPKCCLLVFIDDATSRLVGLRFEENETTAGYFRLTREYLIREGRPLAFYSDRDSIFRVHRSNGVEAETQFSRAMRELGIELICANSPQAKGRVERANGTLQKRLIREMRLQKINTIEMANAFLPFFIQDYNRRFAVTAKSNVNAHRKTLPDETIFQDILSFQETRVLSKNLEMRFENKLYQIQSTSPGYRLRHATITVCKGLDNHIRLRYQGSLLPYKQLEKITGAAEIVSSKHIEKKLKQLKKYAPAKNHPWRCYSTPRENNPVGLTESVPV